MPNRIIKDALCRSDTVNAMTDFQFRLWVSLITYVDDYGRGDARPAIIKGFCFPLRPKISENNIVKGLNALAIICALMLYRVDGRDYLAFPTWEQHQNVRNKRSKFPDPADGELLQTLEINRKQMTANVPVIQSNPILSESESELQKVVEEWKALKDCGVPQIQRMDKGSKRYIAGIKLIEKYGCDSVLKAVRSIQESPFLQGHGEKGWKITFDWFLKPANFEKVLEGNYIRTPQKKDYNPRNTGDHAHPSAEHLKSIQWAFKDLKEQEETEETE